VPRSLFARVGFNFSAPCAEVTGPRSKQNPRQDERVKQAVKEAVFRAPVAAAPPKNCRRGPWLDRRTEILASIVASTARFFWKI
jgi:hypothetical protein